MGIYKFKSRQQILGSLVSKFLAETALNDLNKAGVGLTFMEGEARELFQQYVKMNSILRNTNLDTTTGQDLDDKAYEFNLTRRQAQKATGIVSILRPSSFVKVASSIYAGLPEPVQGNTAINLSDASNPLYGTSGTLIIGRGTSNEEEVSYSVAPVNNTNYWTVILDTPLSRDHGLEETVTLKQGSDEVIPAGTVITVPATSNSPAISFTVNQNTTLLAGEESVDNVGVTCTELGEIGNIPVLAINGNEAFNAEPFAGARVQNLVKFTTGQNREQDDELRDRIKNTIQSLSRGVKSAILNGIIGLVDPDTAKRVVSANVVLPTTLEEWVKVYIDDGTGFEPSFSYQGFESLMESATGGEDRLQLDNFPLMKAQVEANIKEPYNMSIGPLTLTYEVSKVSETITFSSGDFAYPNVATAEEVVRAINNKSTLLEARTSDGGLGFVLTPKTDTNESLQITGGTTVGIFGLPTDLRETLYLYKNDKKLSKDGSTAVLDSGNTENYDFAALGAAPWPLNIVVDGKTANPQVVNFVAADFVDPSSATAEEVVEAINARLAGAYATLIAGGTKVRLVSNKQLSSQSKLNVTGGTANTALGFPTSEVVGSDKDYTLNRFTGTIEFNSPLNANDSVTAGSLYTRAFLTTASPEAYTITAGQTLVFSIDGGSDETVTFANSNTYTAAEVADLINAQTKKAKASVREKGGLNYLELTTNTYSQSLGSVEVKSSSTATSLNFPLDVEVVNQRPHKAFVTSQGSAPFSFVENQSLVVVVDDDPINKTYSVPMNYQGEVTTGTSTTVFEDTNYVNIFSEDDELNGFYLAFKSGDNSTTGTVVQVTNPAGSTFRYIFDSLPTNLSDFAVGDLVSFSGLQNLQNNGSFIVTGVNSSGNGYVEVTNPSGVVENLSNGSALVGQRRAITDYTASTGQITVASALRAIPSASDEFIILPSTINNLVAYMGNTKITTLSTKATIEAADDGSKLQIASKSEGSDGQIRVTGGTANTLLQFPTNLIKGLQGYAYYVGLLSLVNDTIYGSDQNQEAFPGIGAAGIDFEILSPTVQECSFSLDVTLAKGFKLEQMEDEIKSAITAYVNTLGINEDVILAEIVDAVMEIEGITDVKILSPGDNIPIADSEIARTRRSLIFLG